jgi:hypothetical protein
LQFLTSGEISVKIDKFTAAIVGVVLLLLVAAVVTVNLSDDDGSVSESYLIDNEPGTPVHNAFIALQLGDLFMAREQYSARILDEEGPDYAYSPLSGRGGYGNSDASHRLRILSVEIDDQNPDQALVTFVLDTYRRSGPFGTGSTWSDQRTVEVILEDGTWKLNTPEFFY